MKYQLWDMSWMEAEEAFKKSDTVIVPVGTLHGHGPTPISIDSSSAEVLAEEVGKRTGLLTLPLLTYGENEKMKYYPGTIAISQDTLEGVYTDLCRSLHRNGVKKVIFINGHGGNREPLIRAGRTVRNLGMIIAIVEFWRYFKELASDLFPEAYSIGRVELALAIAIGGKDIADLRFKEYKGEWGEPRMHLKNIFGDAIKPLGFEYFDYKGGQIIIPVYSWDVDVAGPPQISKDEVDELFERGKELIRRLVDYIAGFAKEFEKTDISKALESQD